MYKKVDHMALIDSRTPCAPPPSLRLTQVITWSADGCGELLHETTQVFPAKVGEKLVTEQSLRASGTGGLVVCRIADDVSSDTREFRFV